MPKEGTFWFYFNKEQLKKLIDIYGTNNKEELKRKIEAKIFDEKPKESLDTQAKRKKNLKLDLENYLTLKSLNFKHEQIVALINDETTLKELVYPSISQNQSDEKFRGLDCNGYCGTCFHSHFSSNGICSRDNCNCGIRG